MRKYTITAEFDENGRVTVKNNSEEVTLLEILGILELVRAQVLNDSTVPYEKEDVK